MGKSLASAPLPPPLTEVPDGFFSDADFEIGQQHQQLERLRKCISIDETGGGKATGEVVLPPPPSIPQDRFNSTRASPLIKSSTEKANSIQSTTFPHEWTDRYKEHLPKKEIRHEQFTDRSVISFNASKEHESSSTTSTSTSNYSATADTRFSFSMKSEIPPPPMTLAELITEKSTLSMEILDTMDLLKSGGAASNQNLESKLAELQARRAKVILQIESGKAPSAIRPPQPLALITTTKNVPGTVPLALAPAAASVTSPQRPEVPSEWARADFPWTRDLKKAMKQ